MDIRSHDPSLRPLSGQLEPTSSTLGPDTKIHESGRNILEEMRKTKTDSTSKSTISEIGFRGTMFIAGVLTGIAIAGVAAIPLAIAAAGVLAIGIGFLAFKYISQLSSQKKMEALKDEMIKQIIRSEGKDLSSEAIKNFKSPQNEEQSFQKINDFIVNEENFPVTKDIITSYIIQNEVLANIKHKKNENGEITIDDEEIEKFKKDPKRMRKFYEDIVDIKTDLLREIGKGTLFLGGGVIGGVIAGLAVCNPEFLIELGKFLYHLNL